MRILFFVIISFTLTFAQGSWEVQPTNTTKIFRKVLFIDTLYGYAAGDSGLIYKTTNGGEHWQDISINPRYKVHDFSFVSRDTGYLVTKEVRIQPYGTIIGKTIDGGINWDLKPFPISDSYFSGIIFFNPTTGIMMGDSIVKTTDGGNSWRKTNVDGFLANYPKDKIFFYNDSIGVILGGIIDQNGIIWKTTDQGENWETIIFRNSPDPQLDLDFVDENYYLMCGGDLEGGGIKVYTSTDGGYYWKTHDVHEFNLGFVIEARTSSEYWIAAAERIGYTLDSGKTWNIFTEEGRIYHDMHFLDSIHGWAVGRDTVTDNIGKKSLQGRILKYNYKPVSVKEDILITNFVLGQNYPNPFNPATTIKYFIPEKGLVRIKVYDLLGKEIITLINEEKNAGSYEVNLNAEDLASGIYFYRLQSGPFIQTRKMILVK